MKEFLKTAFAAGLLSATAFGTAPAQAGVSIGLSIGIPGAIGFSYDSGGYCDDWGCPDEYWDMPVYYGPVFYDGRWFNGPIYYRNWRGERLYWIRGDWRRDQWRGPRPRWWKGNYRFGPALGYNFYLRNGFRHDRDRYWRGNDWRPGRDWDRNRWRDGRGPWMHPDNNMRGDNRGGSMMMGGHDNDRDNNGHGNSMTGPGGAMTGPGGGSMNGPKPGGGSMTGPGGAMTGPNGGGGSMTGPSGSHGSGSATTGSDNGNASGSNNGSGEKPKHKHHDDNAPGNGGN